LPYDWRQTEQLEPSEDSIRRPSAFRGSDVTRLTRAVQKAGLEIPRVEVNREGVIVVVPGKLGEISALVVGNEWDEVLNGNAPAEVR
jgi:hypothetical protein